MTFSHMDIGELINLGRPPPPLRARALIEGAPTGRGFHTVTHSNVPPDDMYGNDMFTKYSQCVSNFFSSRVEGGLITKYANHLEEIKRGLTSGSSRRFALLPPNRSGI